MKKLSLLFGRKRKFSEEKIFMMLKSKIKPIIIIGNKNLDEIL